MRKKILIALFILALATLIFGAFFLFRPSKPSSKTEPNNAIKTQKNPFTQNPQDKINQAKTIALKGVLITENIEDYESYFENINKSKGVFEENLYNDLLKSLPDFKKIIDELGLKQTFSSEKIEMISAANDVYVFKFYGTVKQEYLKYNESFSEYHIFTVAVEQKQMQMKITKINIDSELNNQGNEFE